MKIRSGRIESPYKLLVYGPEGVGKSTFAAAAERPIFLSVESGTDQLDVDRLGAEEPRTYDEVLELIDELIKDRGDHRTLAVDTIDWLSHLIEDKVCKANNWKGLADDGASYGRGSNATQDEWRRFLALLEKLRRERRMNIIMLAHAQVKRFNAPDSEGYDRYQLKMSPAMASLAKEWCEAVFFAEFETITKRKDGRTRGIATGSRVMRCERTAAYDAKNRLGLPPELPLDFAAFDQARRSDRSAELEAALAAADSEKAATVREWIARQANKVLATSIALQRLQSTKEEASA